MLSLDMKKTSVQANQSLYLGLYCTGEEPALAACANEQEEQRVEKNFSLPPTSARPATAVAARSGSRRPRSRPARLIRGPPAPGHARAHGPRRGSAPAPASVSRGCGRLRRPQLRAQAAACARASPVVSGVGACASGVCRAWYPSEPRGASRGLCSSGSPAPSASVRATRGGRRSNHPP